MSERIFRFEVPVDNQWHRLPAQYTLSVGSRIPGVVEFWCRETDNNDMEYRVYGTGHPIECEFLYEGSVYDASTNSLVWHLVSRTPRD